MPLCACVSACVVGARMLLVVVAVSKIKGGPKIMSAGSDSEADIWYFL